MATIIRLTEEQLNERLRSFEQQYGMSSDDYQDDAHRTIFRYDDAPHHQHLPTFPHHKHIGPKELVVASEGQPTIHRVLTEIAAHVARR